MPSRTRRFFLMTNSFFGREIVGGPLLLVARHQADRRPPLPFAFSAARSRATSRRPPVQFARPMFDWREMQRWGISESRLPPGSEIFFRDPTAWERYRKEILAICAALLAQVALDFLADLRASTSQSCRGPRSQFHVRTDPYESRGDSRGVVGLDRPRGQSAPDGNCGKGRRGPTLARGRKAGPGQGARCVGSNRDRRSSRKRHHHERQIDVQKGHAGQIRDRYQQADLDSDGVGLHRSAEA